MGSLIKGLATMLLIPIVKLTAAASKNILKLQHRIGRLYVRSVKKAHQIILLLVGMALLIGISISGFMTILISLLMLVYIRTQSLDMVIIAGGILGLLCLFVPLLLIHIGCSEKRMLQMIDPYTLLDHMSKD